MSQPSLRERLRYSFDRAMSRGTPAPVGLLALASLLLVVVVGFAAAAFSEAGVTRTLWMSLLRTLDPGTMGNDEGDGVSCCSCSCSCSWSRSGASSFRLTIALADGAFMAIEAGGIDLDVAGDVTADVLVGAIECFEVSSLSTTSTRGI